MAWNDLLGVLQTVRAEADANAAGPKVACPLHGDPLDKVRGVLHCPMGHVVTIY